jgi:hypothetical protein
MLKVEGNENIMAVDVVDGNENIVAVGDVEG